MRLWAWVKLRVYSWPRTWLTLHFWDLVRHEPLPWGPMPICTRCLRDFPLGKHRPYVWEER